MIQTRLKTFTSFNCCSNHDIPFPLVLVSSSKAGVRQSVSHSNTPNQISSFLIKSQVDTTDHLLRNGLASASNTITSPCPPSDLTSAFGDHDSLIGALSKTSGSLYLLDRDGTNTSASPSSPSTLVLSSNQDSPPLSHISLTSSNHLAACIKPSPSANLSHILTFTTPSHFTSWFADPTNASHAPSAHHMLPGHCIQLIANATGFLALMNRHDTMDNEVYTWGDARYRTLARSTTATPSDDIDSPITPASKPGLVGALGGIPITKISTNGWLSAALSSDSGSAYLWGPIGVPGRTDEDGEIECLKCVGIREVALIEIIDEESEEVMDVLDVAVGTGHVVVLCEGGRVFGVGSNENGQLGIGAAAGGGKKFYEGWTEIVHKGASAVEAGPKATFVRLTTTTTTT